jgi:meiotically up-regulated gene 157 (Mug157) protein
MNQNRAQFLKQILIAVCLLSVNFALSSQSFPTVRVEPAKRNFVSTAIENKILEMQNKIQGAELSWLFSNCFPNTLDRTVTFSMKNGKPDTFVITGDINAMWLRDCTAQVWPYMPYIKQDNKLKQMIAGLINRQVQCVLIDPYANAFNKNTEGSEWQTDLTTMRPELHERKWEVDGLCYVIRLSYKYWKETGDVSCFDADWQKAMKLIVKTFREQQRKTDKGPYIFQRVTAKASDTQFGKGYGNPMRPTGLICSMFRPSDDATTYPFLIPSNCFAVVSLHQLAEMEKVVLNDNSFSVECADFAKEVDAAIQKYGIVNHSIYGKIYAYEVDGFGNYLMMDDANVPSLLALPYLGYVNSTDSIYKNTRKFGWSTNNPYFYCGKFAEGIGGPHMGENMIWPMSIIMKALTSNDKEEISECLRLLKQTHAGAGFMHESFNKDNPADYTRSWFAWANTLFGELIIRVERDYPDLLNNK